MIMRDLRWALWPLMAITLSGCGTVADPTSWLASAEIDPPTELTDFKKVVEVKTVWSASVGDSNDQRLNLKPLYLNKRIYVANADGNVSSLDARTGSKIWSVKIEAAVAGGPGVGEGLVLLGTSDAEVIALDEDTGAEVWRTRVSSEVLSTPAATLGRVVVRTIDGKIIGLDASDGTEIWRFERKIPVLTLRGTGSPVIHGSSVLCGMAGGKLLILDIRSGDVIWDATISVPRGRSELERLSDIDGDPLVRDGAIYVATYQGDIAALSIQSGTVIWRRKFSSYSRMAADNLAIYASDADGSVWAMDTSTGAARWRQEGLKNRQLSDVAVFEGVVAVADFEGYVHFLSTEDGSFIGRTRVGSDPITQGIFAAEGRLFVQGNGGVLEALSLSVAR